MLTFFLRSTLLHVFGNLGPIHHKVVHVVRVAVEHEESFLGLNGEVGLYGHVVLDQLEDVGIVGQHGVHHQERRFTF